MSKNGCGKFVLGALIGVGIGVLIAPKKGSETREDLKKKIDELLQKVKEIDKDEVKKQIEDKLTKLKNDIKELDKEKVLSIAKEKCAKIKEESKKLVELAKEKGTPVLEKAASDVRDVAIKVTKDILEKLENGQKKIENK